MEIIKKTYTLLELTSSLQRAINKFYSQPYWVKAEMHKLNLTAKGHCFPELVQKEDTKVVAQMRGTIWATQFTDIRRRFEETVKEPLRDGLTLLFLVQVKFDSVYGLSLQILDIDPNYTLGELHKQREETLKKLKEQNLLNRNQLLSLPKLPKNLAIISVESSKGLSDFLTILKQNEFNYGFNTHLFPAVLDGDRAVETIVAQLRKIKKFTSFFDAVVIVRGGGGEIGMTCYNDFTLCAEIANFPLPILTGIGHSTNLTVAEMIAYKSAITPTQLAESFVKIFREFDLSVLALKQLLAEEVRTLLLTSEKSLLTELRIFKNSSVANILSVKQQLKTSQLDFQRAIKLSLKENKEELKNITKKTKQGMSVFHRLEILKIENIQHKIKNQSKRNIYNQSELIQQIGHLIYNKVPVILSTQQRELEHLSNTIKVLSPENLLKKGYTISLINGKAISQENKPSVGDKLETITLIGKLESTIEKIERTL